jgi:hypothetical protein
MLDQVLADRVVPGTNVKGDMAGANWTFLLPSLELAHVVCLGLPTPAETRTFRRLAPNLTILDPRRRSRTPDYLSELPQVRCHRWRPGQALPLADAAADLVVVTAGGGTALLAHDQALLADIRRVLSPRGVIYCSSSRWRDRLRGHPGLRVLQAQWQPLQSVVFTPLAGDDPRTAVPSEDQAVLHYAQEQRLDAPSFSSKWAQRLERRLRQRLPIVSRLLPRGLLLENSASAATSALPNYLLQIGARAGLDLSQARWALAAKGRYSSRKVLFFLFQRGSAEPRWVIKLTRDGQFNARLQNEDRSLRLLHEQWPAAADFAPRAEFFGEHGGLAILGENFLAGQPLEQQSSLTPDCPLARGMVDSLTQMAAQTASPVPSAQLADALDQLLRQFLRIYPASAELRQLLEAQVETVVAAAGTAPCVFQHGDPGVWNTLARAGGAPFLLDWEAAEPSGAPLWDVLYFLRSYSVRIARRQGVRSALEALGRHWLQSGPVARMMAAALNQYGAALELNPPLARPLFYFCWVHRAIKESRRLKPEKLHNGHYLRLLQMLTEHRQAAALATMLSLNTPAARPARAAT